MPDKDSQLRGKLEDLFSDLSESIQAEPSPAAPLKDTPERAPGADRLPPVRPQQEASQHQVDEAHPAKRGRPDIAKRKGAETTQMQERHVRASQQTSRAMPGRRQNARPTLGYLAAEATTTYNVIMLAGLAEAARERDANLISFVGGGLHFSPDDPFTHQRNALYDLVTTSSVDGLIINSTVGNYVTTQELGDFYDHYRPLPVVSIAEAIPGFASILVDNERGMRDVIVHLIEKHGCRRIAFIRGPEDNDEAEQRYHAYTQVLAEYGLPFNPDLVAPGTFLGPSGAAAIRLLMDERKQQPGKDFEAVAAAADAMAISALEALQARGIYVPDDVAVVGFDDIEEARSVTPPLTTVRQPLPEQGKRAAEKLLALSGLIQTGEPVLEQMILPTELIVRRSCGCLDPAVVQAEARAMTMGDSRSPLGESLEAILAARRQEILFEMAQTGSHDPALAEQLLDAFSAELKGESPGAFLSTLENSLRQVVKAGGSAAAWQGTLSALRRHTLPHLDNREMLSRAENLWQQARVMIGEMAWRAQVQQGLQTERQTQMLQGISQALITATNVTELMDVLAQELPRLGIPSCYLSLYEDPKAPAEWSRLMLAYDENGRVELEPDGQRFPSPQLVPEGMLSRDRPYSMVVEPLYFREDQIGLVLFEMGAREGTVYEALRGQLSSALKGILLLEQRQAAEAERERLLVDLDRRARQLQTAAEVSRAASSILNLDELLPQVVELIRDRFNLYYVGIFLVNEADKYAVLRAGSGEAGRKMIEVGHKLEVGGASMIGWCIANQKARIALDVGKEATHFSNPLLPETRSELALPLVSRGEVIGALTVQSAQAAAFSDEDLTVLQTMADQVANAIANAQLYDQSQKEITERKRTEEALAQEQYLMHALMNNLPDHIYFKDAQSRFIRISKSQSDLFGLSDPAQAVGKSDFDFFSEEHARPAYEDEQEIIRTGRPLVGVEEKETWANRPDTWVSTTKMPLRDEAGNIVGTFGTSSDITERKRAEVERERLLAEVERRALQLQTAAEVSRAASSILDPDELLPQVVELIRDRFNLYYVGLFLVDETGQRAILQAGTSEAGQAMMATHHRLEISGSSMIGWCIANQQARIALDVGQEAVRFANPLLPMTRSEMALPLVSRGHAIGAMTIQSDQPAAFTQEDINVHQSMADQTANAIENARLFEESQRRAARERMLNEMANRIRAGLTLEQVLNATVQEVGMALGAARVAVRLKPTHGDGGKNGERLS